MAVKELLHVPAAKPGTWIYVAACSCDCGKSKDIRIGSLLSGATRSCGCSKARYEKTTGEKNKGFKGYKEIRSHFWRGYQAGAKERGIEFSITMEYAWSLFEKQERKCALSGVPLVFGVNAKNSLTTASIDRIESSKGYVEGNVQWVHKRINVMKHTSSVEDFVMWCRRVVEADDHLRDRGCNTT